MRTHVTLVAVLHIAFGALGILVAMVLFLAIVGGGLLSGDGEAIFITSTVGSILAGFLTLVSLPELIAGIGLMNRWSWARGLMLVVAILELLHIPFGTILGIYTLWVLLNAETIELFRSAERY